MGTGRSMGRLGRLPHFGWLLAALAASQLLVNWAWIGLDRQVGGFLDAEHHLTLSVLYRQAFEQGGGTAVWRTIGAMFERWPPLVHLGHATLATLFSDDPLWIRRYSALLLPLLLWGTYRLGRLYLPAPMALVAAVLCGFCSGVTAHGRCVGLDLPCATILVWTAAVALRPPGLVTTRRALLAGLLAGLSVLVRLQAVIFLLGPALWIAVHTVRQANHRRDAWRAAGRVTLAAAVALTISAPWWSGHVTELLALWRLHATPHAHSGSASPTLAAGLVHYLGAIGKVAGWVPLLGLLGWGAVALRRWRPPLRPPAARPGLSKLPLVLWVVLATLIHAATVHSWPRYMIPVMPPLAILSAAGLHALGARWSRRLGLALMSTTVLLFLVQSSMHADALSPRSPIQRLHRLGLVYAPYWDAPRPEPRALAAAALVAAAVRSHARAGRPAYLAYHDPSLATLPRMVPQLAAWTHRLPVVPTIPPLLESKLHLRLQNQADGQIFLLTSRRLYTLLGVARIPSPMEQQRTSFVLYQLEPGCRIRGLHAGGGQDEPPAVHCPGRAPITLETEPQEE